MLASPLWYSYPHSTEIDVSACKIRAIGLQDLEPVAEVLANSFYPPKGWQRWLYPVFRFSIYEDLKARLQAGHRYYCCLAAIAPHKQTRQPHIVGTLELSHRYPPTWLWHRPQQMYLSNLAVLHTCRRQGIARQLLAAAEQQTLDWGFHDLYLHVMMDNIRARQLYHNTGYRVHKVETTLLSWINLQPPRLLLRKTLHLKASERSSEEER